MTADKFAWLRAVHADDRIPLGEKAILGHAAIFDVFNGSDVFCIRQATLADHCGTTERTVRQAIKRAKTLGYLVAGQPRKRGPGAHRADELRLTMPELPEVSSGHYRGELPEDTSPSNRKILPELPEDTSGAYKEYGSLNGSLGGGSARRPELPAKSVGISEAGTDRPPTCSKHPNGPYHDENCRQCKLWREWLEAQPQRAEEARRRKAKRRQATIEACNRCDDNGMIDLGNSVRRCLHDAEKVMP